MHQSESSLCRRWAWPRVLHAPIRVQFIQEMGVAERPVCTNQSSVYTGDGHGRGSCMHQLEFSLCRRWAWPRVLYAPIRVQFIQEMGVAEGPVCTNQSSVYTGLGYRMHHQSHDQCPPSCRSNCSCIPVGKQKVMLERSEYDLR